MAVFDYELADSSIIRTFAKFFKEKKDNDDGDS
jgi:hypothetical protein